MRNVSCLLLCNIFVQKEIGHNQNFEDNLKTARFCFIFNFIFALDAKSVSTIVPLKNIQPIVLTGRSNNTLVWLALK